MSLKILYWIEDPKTCILCQTLSIIYLTVLISKAKQASISYI